MGLCGFGFGGYKEKIDPKIVLVSLFRGRLLNKLTILIKKYLRKPCIFEYKALPNRSRAEIDSLAKLD